MKFNNKKIISFLTTSILLGLFVAPAALAAECDQDGDGYIAISNIVMREIAPNTPYADSGNYSPIQWEEYYNIYKGAELTEEETCDELNFKKGAEPKRCDSPVIGKSSNVYDPAKVTTPLRGSQVNPGAFDAPDNGIDEDCDGKDATLLADTGNKDLGGLVDKVISLLSKLVVAVSILVMIWGGVLYATAAGDEAKTSKARKAIIGAVIGLIIGLLAPTIVNMVASNLV